MTLATITGLFLFGFVALFLTIGAIGAIAAAGETTPVMPKEAVLQIDFTKMSLAEQTKEADPLAMLQGSGDVTPVGIYSAINAINAKRWYSSLYALNCLACNIVRSNLSISPYISPRLSLLVAR